MDSQVRAFEDLWFYGISDRSVFLRGAESSL